MYAARSSTSTIIGVAVLLALSCSSKPEPSTAGHPTAEPEITSESEEGFYDLVFAIAEDTRSVDGGRRLIARGKANGLPVAFAVHLGPNWKEGAIKDVPLKIHQGRVSLAGTGPESDRLLQVMDGLYGTKLLPQTMIDAAEFGGLSLEGNPSRLDDGPVKIKLFYESEDEERYAELFLNIDVKASKLYLNEKDPEYRVAVIRALSRKGT